MLRISTTASDNLIQTLILKGETYVLSLQSQNLQNIKSIKKRIWKSRVLHRMQNFINDMNAQNHVTLNKCHCVVHLYVCKINIVEHK